MSLTAIHNMIRAMPYATNHHPSDMGQVPSPQSRHTRSGLPSQLVNNRVLRDPQRGHLSASMFYSSKTGN